MKKSCGKYLSLATMLGLCLALSGCYIAPDDINDSNQYRTNSGNLPFQTLAPTATVAVTPDTVVVETQNLYHFQNGGTIAVTQSVPEQTDIPAAAETPTPTPAAGNAGWSEWGTVSGVTGTPETE